MVARVAASSDNAETTAGAAADAGTARFAIREDSRPVILQTRRSVAELAVEPLADA